MEKLKRNIYKIYEKSLDVMTFNKRRYLRNKKIFQRELFDILIKDLNKNYKNLEEYDISKFTIPNWDIYNNNLKNSLLNLNFSFLRNKVIRSSMFITLRGKLLKQELDFLESNVQKSYLKFLLEEESVGNPILLNSNYITSHSTIHNLYHLVFFIIKLNKNLNKCTQIVEWGGGYGNLARLFMKIGLSGKTYIIIDTPLFSCIQWIYLSSVFGEDKINLIKKEDNNIKEGKINLLPICFLEHFNLNADLFISTWALNESSVYSQEYVKNKDFFGAKHFLIAVGEQNERIPYSNYLVDFYRKNSFLFYDIENIKGSKYIFK